MNEKNIYIKSIGISNFDDWRKFIIKYLKPWTNICFEKTPRLQYDILVATSRLAEKKAICCIYLTNNYDQPSYTMFYIQLYNTECRGGANTMFILINWQLPSDKYRKISLPINDILYTCIHISEVIIFLTKKNILGNVIKKWSGDGAFNFGVQNLFSILYVLDKNNQ